MEGKTIAGEQWRSTFQVGLESVAGTPVAATRKMYFDPKSTLTRDRKSSMMQYATGTRDNQRDIKLSTVDAGGKISGYLDAGEIVELLLASVQGGVTGTQNASTGQYDWVFKPGNTLDSQTYEWYDGQRGWQLNGALIDELKLAGTATGMTSVDATLFGRDLVAHALTGSLAERTPNAIQGWEMKLFVDAIGATPGTTNVPGTIKGWTVTLKNGAVRDYYGDNTTAAGAVNLDALSIDAELVFTANAAAFAEFGNWDAGTQRLVRLELGNNGAVIGTSTIKPTIWLDMPGAWTGFDLSGVDAKTRVYKLKYSYLYDQTNGYSFQATARNSRATAY